LDGSAGGTCDDDSPSADADAGADRRQQEREALLAEGPFEWRGHADVVPHPDPPREFHISSSPAGMAAQGLRLREPKERHHALAGDPALHAAVPALHHVVAQPSPRIKSFAATNL